MENIPTYTYHQLRTAYEVVSKQQCECIITNGDCVQTKIALSRALKILSQEVSRLEKKYPEIVNAANKMNGGI